MSDDTIGLADLADAFEWAAGLIRAALADNTPLGLGEVAHLLHVRTTTVVQWRQRQIFPPVDLTVGGSPAWRRSTVLQWAEHTGRWREGQPVTRNR